MRLLESLLGRNVDKLKAKKDVRGLIRVMKQNHPATRTPAKLALVEIGMPAVRPLIGLLMDERERPYWAKALRTLVLIGRPAVEPLIELLRDKRYFARALAAEGLGLIKDARALAPLAALLKDRATDVRDSAVLSLGVFHDPQAVEALVQVLEDTGQNLKTRALAAQGLGNIGDAAALPQLIRTHDSCYSKQESRDGDAFFTWIYRDHDVLVSKVKEAINRTSGKKVCNPAKIMMKEPIHL